MPFTEDEKNVLEGHLLKYWQDKDKDRYKASMSTADQVLFGNAMRKMMSFRVFKRWADILNIDLVETLTMHLKHGSGDGVIVEARQMLTFISTIPGVKSAIDKIPSSLDEDTIKRRLRERYSVWGKIMGTELGLATDATDDRTIAGALDQYVELVETVAGIYDWTQNIDTVYDDDPGKYKKNLLRARSRRRRQRILGRLHSSADDEKNNETGTVLGGESYDYDYILVSWLRHAFPYVDGQGADGVRLMNHISFSDAKDLMNDGDFRNELTQNLEVLYQLVRFGVMVDETRAAAAAAFSWREHVTQPTIISLLNRIQLSMCNTDVERVAYPLLFADPTAMDFAEKSVVVA